MYCLQVAGYAILLLQLYVVSAWPFELIPYWRSGLQGV